MRRNTAIAYRTLREYTLPRWRKRRASDKQPENFAMFSSMFAAFVDGIQKNGNAAKLV
jgi:hypothetical protein